MAVMSKSHWQPMG